MNPTVRYRLAGPASRRAAGPRIAAGVAWLGLAMTALPGCGPDAPPAIVEGILQRKGAPLDNCLITFLPEPADGIQRPHSTGLTDHRGVYRLRFASQTEGAAVGSHRVTVQDMSVSTGVRRRDHGSVDEEAEDTHPRPAVRPSRVPQIYLSPQHTPLRREVKPGHQKIDLEIT